MQKKVILRQERSKSDSRFLSASYAPNGDLIFEGQDLGDSVRAAFDCTEYEWTWTIRASSLPALEKALGNPVDLLSALQQNFSNADAALLGNFLETHKIAYRTWSRTGD